MLNLKEALRFPLQEPGARKRVLIGGALNLLPVVNLLAWGYAFRIFRAFLQREDPPLPPWEGWADLLLAGTIILLIELGYGIVPLLMVAMGLGLLVKGGTLMWIGLVVIIIGMLGGLTVGFFLPMGLARYALVGRIEAAFQPQTLWTQINKNLGDYVAAFLFCLLCFLITGLLLAIPYLGLPLWLFISFYLMLAFAKLFGEACSRATQPG